MKFTITKFTLGLTFLSLAACSAVSPINSIAPNVQSFSLPSSVQYPNGITHTPDGTIFVGSVVSGDIWRKRPDSEFELAFSETPSRFAGTALRYDPLTKYLWVASPDFLGREVNGETVKRPHRIAVIDTKTNTEFWSIEMPAGGFGNDFTLDGQGGVFLTDSSLDKVWHIPSVGSQFVEVASGELLEPGSLGPAGIAFYPDGKLVTGLFSDGELLVINLNENNTAASVEKLTLTRKIENPDGLFALPDHQLLIVEGAVDSGNGKLLLVDLDGQTPRKISVLAEGIDSPLNLTVSDGNVFITEGRVRHLMLPNENIVAPNDFSVKSIKLSDTLSRPYLLLPRGSHPESISASHGKYLYTGSAVTSEIFRTDIETGHTELFVATNSNLVMSVLGLMASEETGVLYACTANLGKHVSQKVFSSKLIGFDLYDGHYLNHWDLPGEGFCNDISKFEDNRLLITDTANPYLLMFNPSNDGTLEVWFENEALGGAQFNGNGIVWDEDARAVYLTTFQNGDLLRINLSEIQVPKSVEILDLPRPLDGADALRLLSSNKLLLFENGLSTGSNGQITHVTVKDNQVELKTIANGMTSPTSGVVVKGTIYAPNSHFGTLFLDGQVSRRQPEIRRLSE